MVAADRSSTAAPCARSTWSRYPERGISVALDRLHVASWADRVRGAAGRPRPSARDLAAFVKALHEIDASGGPPQEAPLAGRGGPLAKRDDAVGKALSDLHGVVDVEAAAAAWRLALETPLWDGQPAWIHGDLQHSNFLVEEGRLSGIIDFGGLGVGDPAADLIPAWSFFGESSRKIYRDVLEVDYATWARGRGWALSVGLIALPYYRDTNPVIMDWSLAAVEAVLADQPSGPSS